MHIILPNNGDAVVLSEKITGPTENESVGLMRLD